MSTYTQIFPIESDDPSCGGDQHLEQIPSKLPTPPNWINASLMFGLEGNIFSFMLRLVDGGHILYK